MNRFRLATQTLHSAPGPQSLEMQPTLTIHPIASFPFVEAGDDIARALHEALTDTGVSLRNGDVVVIAQKIVSLSEGRKVRLDDVAVSAAARDIAAETEKDPRLVELILQESDEVIRKRPGVIIVRHRLGLVGANAGIDQSNIDQSDGECALLLPEDPDRSATKIRQALLEIAGQVVGVIISDSMNRPWRLGSVGAAIGSAGLDVLEDRRGKPDLFGRELKVTVANRADAIAAAAVLVMGESTEATPVVIVRGLNVSGSTQAARDCVRPVADDLFR